MGGGRKSSGGIVVDVGLVAEPVTIKTIINKRTTNINISVAFVICYLHRLKIKIDASL